MKYQGRIAVFLSAAVLTVSFVHPFSGKMSFAKETGTELSEKTELQTLDETEAFEESGRKEVREEEYTGTARIKEAAPEQEETAKDKAKQEPLKEAEGLTEGGQAKETEAGKKTGRKEASEVAETEETEDETAPQPEAENETEPEQETGTEPEQETGTEPEQETETEPEQETETEPERETETEIGPEQKTETEPAPEAENETESEQEIETEPGREGETEHKAECEQEAETENGETEIHLSLPVAVRAAVNTSSLIRSSLGISDSAPRAGQVNRYEYTGSTVEWTVPVSGTYEIVCQGAEGGTANGAAGRKNQYGDGAEAIQLYAPAKGDSILSQVYLQKGMRLQIRAGGMGGNGQADDMYDGAGGTGGYPDGRAGIYTDHWGGCVNEYDGPAHCAWAGTGGSGGSSSVEIDGSRIISAQGGDGGYTLMSTCGRPNKKTEASAGGGSTAIWDTDRIKWDREKTLRTENNINAGSGRVIITLCRASVSFVLQAEPEGPVNQDVVLSAKLESPGEGLPELCIAWEKDGEGNDIWTDTFFHTVTQNGTYTCRIRDIYGTMTEESVQITNIDKLRPQVSLEPDTTQWTASGFILRVLGDDAEATQQYAKSGLDSVPYLWGRLDTAGDVKWDTKEPDENGNPQEEKNEPHETDSMTELWKQNHTCSVSENGTYLCKVRDRAGNVTELRYNVKNIDHTPPRVTCQKPEKWYGGSMQVVLEAEDLQPDGTQGCGLAEEAFSTDGITFGSSPVVVIEKEGPSHIWVKDRLGNVRKETFTFMYDIREPEKKTEQTQNNEKSKGGGGKQQVQLPALLLPEPEAVETATETPAYKGTGLLPEPVRQKPEEDSTKKQIIRLLEQPLEPVETETETTPRFDRKKKKLSEKQEQNEELPVPETLGQKPPEKPDINWKKAALYSAWTAVVLCGLVWLLFCLIFEHARVYKKDENGTYRKIGRCAILRRKEYKQINLLHLMKKGEDRDYKVRFARGFVMFHRKEKIMIRTWYGVELRNIEKEIEIASCNSENPVLI